MLSSLVLLMSAAVALHLAGVLRRRDPGQRMYALLVAGVLVLLLLGALRGDRFTALCGLGFGVLIVVIPWGLDLLVRACFARERLAWAVRFARWRVVLMPGAGLSRQQEILEGLALLEQQGVDSAVAHFRALVARAEDETELALLHEQIVSMLLYGQRWSDGIAHYEARFAPSYAAARPPLALGLLRAYGESGALSRAAALLQSIETRLGPDPRAAGIVSQARLTFLAYAGESAPVAAALTEDRRRRLGLSPANVALYRGIALSRAGQVEAAQVELGRVEEVARARDERVVSASRKAIAALPIDAVELEPELAGYAEAVAERLEGFFSITPAVRRSGPLRVTPVLMVLLVAGYLGTLAVGGGGPGLLRVGGATPQLVAEGGLSGLARVFSGLLVQVDAIELLLAMYGVWMVGPLVERILGRARLVVVSVGAGAAGLAMAAVVRPTDPTVLGGASLMTVGVFVAALWIVASPRTPLARRTRRALSLPLLLLLLAIGLSTTRTTGLALTPAAIAASAVVGGLGALLAPPQGWRHRVFTGLAALLVAACAASAVIVGRSAPTQTLAARTTTRTAAGVQFDVPSIFGVVDEAGARRPSAGIPTLPGLVDRLARQVGDHVQVVVVPNAERSALLRAVPELARDFDEIPGEPPASFAEAYVAALGDTASPPPLRTTRLRRNGEDEAIVIERAFGDDDGDPALVLIAAPVSALDHGTALYAAILAGAQPHDTRSTVR